MTSLSDVGRGWHDLDWIGTCRRTNRIDNLSARYLSSSLAEIARDSGKVTGRISPTRFPWGRPADEIGARMLAMRVNYVGELGWELHVPWTMADP
jgi:dimethylglycine dehydrogenase